MDQAAIEDLAAAFPAGRWQARWIWGYDDGWVRRGVAKARSATRVAGMEAVLPPELSKPPESWVLFRRVFDLDAVPAVVPVRLAVDGRYVLWVNGVEVCRGPVRGDPNLLHCDVVDLAPHLAPGTNCVAIHAP